MSRTTKRLLSILLAAAMILSFGITGWAIDDINVEVEPNARPAVEKDPHVTSGFDGGTELELEEIDPSTLNVPKLGEIEEDEIEPEDLPFGLNDIVRVSIVLDRPATMAAGYSTQNIADNGGAMAYRRTLQQQQAAVEAKIAAAGVSMNVKWNLTLAVNVISAEVRYADVETIEAIPGVKEVWFETRYEPQVDSVNTVTTTEHMVGAVEVWNSGYTGAGTRVAIIDTGTDQNHQSFDPEALEYALAEDGGDYNLLTWDEISSVASQLNAPVTSQVYKNTKIPYAYNYIDGNYTTDHMSDRQEEHGSHVSGIAAANRYVKVDGEFVDAAENFWAVGVAPDAQILTMKVFGAGGGAYDSDYMSAIEDAIILKADSVNLSLGSGNPGLTFSNGYQDVMDSLIACGTVVSISAGNSYNWADFLPSGVPYLYLEDVSLHTGGSPGTFVNSLCVAAAENIGAIAAPLYFNGDQMVVYTETEGYGNALINTIAGSYEYVLVDGPGVDDNANVGAAGDAFFALGSDVVKGKVAICFRGSSSFFAKANAAAAQGAAAVIIINNTDGVIRMNLSDYEYTVPVVSILQADGRQILRNSTRQTDANGNVYYTGTVQVTEEIMPVLTTAREDASITEFSSWGVPGSLIMKPEITAPGGDIYSVAGIHLDKDTGAVVGGTDTYEFMSGTSMAAPHITGMAALVGQYIRENKLEEITGQNRRTLINSLLMSTATPMIVDGAYLSILQQGSGLADTFAATQAKAYILMGDDATASAADGKVKVELGQDAAREGVYSYSFSVNNFSDKDTVYVLGTDLFMQWVAGGDGQGNLLLDTATQYLGGDYTEAYDYPTLTPNFHDVDKDGDTDQDDAQAILDYLTGAVAGEDLDLEAGEMDGVEGLSSYDAQLLLEWLEEQGADQLVVPAHDSVTVVVTLTLSDDLKEFLDYYFTSGTYIEGFTYLDPKSETEDGELLDVMHSIPILGFYGRWTDASMFDCVDPISKAYGSTKVSYTGNAQTNYLTLNYGKGNTVFMGNPYAVEEEFPADRLAVNGSTKLANFKYNLIRNATSAGWMAIDLSSMDILDSKIGGGKNGAWYYVNGQAWQDTMTQTEKIGTTAAKLGLEEDDVFLLGYFAVPEYYGMLLHPGENVNTVTDEEILELMLSDELGAGSMLGYAFTVDNTVPTAEAKLSDDGSKITVTAQDNNYIAYVAIMDVGGNVVFAGEVPEQNNPGEEIEVTFDISDMDLPNGVAIFVGDYATNEKAYLIIFDPDQPITASKTVYMLTDTLEAGKDYVIATSDEAGVAYALLSQGQQSYTGAANVQIVVDENGTYIPVEAVADTIVWTTGEDGSDEDGYTFANKDDGGALGYNSLNGPYVNWTNPDYADNFVYQNNYLLYAALASYGYGMGFTGANFIFTSSESITPVYLYTPVTLEIELDPTNASSVTVAPEAATLILDVIPTVELIATVEPIVLPDLSVTWTSSDPSVATVDENGLVTAVAPGMAIITAASNQTPNVTGSATIYVTSGEPMDAVVYGQVAFGDKDIEYAEIDLSSMGVTDLSNNAMFSAFYGGGVSGEYVYGNDIDNDFHRYNWNDGFSYDSEYHFSINATWAAWDIACFPSFTIADYKNVDTTDEDETNDVPAYYDYPYILSSFNSSSKLTYFTEEGDLTYFDLADLGNFVAVTFAGAELDQDTNELTLYYVLLADDGNLYIWSVSPNFSSGSARMSADYGVLAHVNVLTFGEDGAAYSMSYYETDTSYGVFIADSSIGGIYWVDLTERANGEVNAHFVGKIDGATSLSSLSDLHWDTLGSIGTIPVNVPSDDSGDDGDSLRGLHAPAFAADVVMSGNVLYSIEDSLFETESVEIPDAQDDIILESVEDDEIVIVGGLDAIRDYQPRRSVNLLDAAVLLNPDYEEDDHVEIAITAPDAKEEGDAFYNGFATVSYDSELLTFQELIPNDGLTITSFTVDEDEGLIKFAYASLDPVEEKAAVATVIFSLPAAPTVVTVTTVESNDDLEVNEITKIKLGEGFAITIVDYTKGKATCSIDDSALYAAGDFTFTVAADKAVLVAVKNTADDDETYQVVKCVTDAETDEHSFTITIEEDVTVVLAYKGDINLDGRVRATDGTEIKKHVAGITEITGVINLLVADTTGDGRIRATDGNLVGRSIVGTSTIKW